MGEQTGPKAKIWEEKVVIPTYPALAPDRNPMFLEKRVYQGSKGTVYPLPFTDHISDERVDQAYNAVFLENEYLRVMVLPELGGRIHTCLDKTNNYDIVYNNHVIKPALVGLAGPWISGGIEFNWPQHHRPTTFQPVVHITEENSDGSVTVWLSEIEPFNHLKGMAGITLHPGKSYMEVKVRLYNRTALPQTFLWWANLAVAVNDHYQTLFPPDVHFVADHAKRAVSTFPIATGTYYGVDYAPGTDISWFKNIPVPTSYMALASTYNFLGGYDHGRNAGIMHVADHHISPGKKMWTWGADEFGARWYDNLTDADGPYIELMTGVYTDNQPDFSWLQPYETKSFSQFWYPLRDIGAVKNANLAAAVNLEAEGDGVRIGVNATSKTAGARLVLTDRQQQVLWAETVDLAPDQPFRRIVSVDASAANAPLRIEVLSAEGESIISYIPSFQTEDTQPQAAKVSPPPQALDTTEKLYLTGLHLEQYRHATYDPAPYYREALQRDPTDARNNNALGLLLLRRGEFAQAAHHFRTAITALTQKNPNPYDGEPYYNLGLALRFCGDLTGAYDAFFKATWNYAWQAASYYALAEIACMQGNEAQALDHARRSLETNSLNPKARNLQTALLRKQGHLVEAEEVARGTLVQDMLDFWARNELYLISRPIEYHVMPVDPHPAPAHPSPVCGRGVGGEGNIYNSPVLDIIADQRNERERAQRGARESLMRDNAGAYLDIAGDYAAAGLWAEAFDLLLSLAQSDGMHTDPMIAYHMGYYAEKQGHEAEAHHWYGQASTLSPDYCFPNRLESIAVLQAAQVHNPLDARAPYYLGNLFYDKKRHAEAIALWERSRQIDPTFSIVHRNLGLAYYNIERDLLKAKDAYTQAFAADPTDARILYESDQLDKRLNTSPRKRLTGLEGQRTLVERRDDLYVELITLYNQNGDYDTALALLENRHFHPWEGGEGKVTEQYVLAHLLRGQQRLAHGQGYEALDDFLATLTYPQNLGEGQHAVLNSAARSFFMIGLGYENLGDTLNASVFFAKAIAAPTPHPDMYYYKGLALRHLGKIDEAQHIFAELVRSGHEKLATQPKLDYFATSLPDFLIFEDDLAKRNEIEAYYILSLGYQGLGEIDKAKTAFETVLALECNQLPPFIG